jgi:hypothetical protein
VTFLAGAASEYHRREKPASRIVWAPLKLKRYDIQPRGDKVGGVGTTSVQGHPKCIPEQVGEELRPVNSVLGGSSTRLGEATVKSRRDFNPARNLTRRNAVQGLDQDGRPYVRLDIPATKTTRPGVSQSVWLVPQGELCAIDALRNLAKVVPAGETDPLFCWRDDKKEIRPMAKPRIMERIKGILDAINVPRTFGHSFCISGASFYMANKVDPEIVRIAGRWRSLAYETYIRSFEQVISRHLEILPGA